MSKGLIAIIDYGMGNLHSVAKAFEHVAPNFTVKITADPGLIGSAERVVLPGVGAIGDCMAAIKERAFDQLVARSVEQGQPLLGICVGMQTLMSHSEENDGIDCLNVFAGPVKRFAASLTDASGAILKVPHMGWNQVYQRAEHPLWQGIESGSRFYFVHSYYAPTNPDYCCGEAEYGVPFAAMVYRNTLFATQFHPEKSHQAGLRLLQNFAQWQG